MVHHIHASLISSAGAFQRNPAKVIQAAQDEPVAILDGDAPVAYVLSPTLVERWLQASGDAWL